MTELATILRAAQLYAHAAHNEACGPTFFADHEYLGDLYGAYESAYDAVVERSIGLGIAVDLASIGVEAANRASMWGGKQTASAFDFLLDVERGIVSEARRLSPFSTFGTVNLLSQLADDSEARQYKLLRRTMAQSPAK